MDRNLMKVLNRIERANDAVESESWNNNDLLDELKDILKDNNHVIDYSVTGGINLNQHSSVETTSKYLKK